MKLTNKEIAQAAIIGASWYRSQIEGAEKPDTLRSEIEKLRDEYSDNHQSYLSIVKRGYIPNKREKGEQVATGKIVHELNKILSNTK